MDLRPISLDAVTVTSSSKPVCPLGGARHPPDRPTWERYRASGPVRCPAIVMISALPRPAVHCPAVVILQIGQTRIFKLALENAGRPGLARCASSAVPTTLVKRHGFRLRPLRRERA